MPLEQFAERVIAAQEAERRRLAGDIHDGISQRLISLSYHLDAAADALRDAPEFTAGQLVLAREMIDLTLNEARAAISGLRPPVLDDLGLADGLASLARSISGVQVVVEADECTLPEHVEIALYRIAQEALQNVVKHAGASAAGVELRCDPGLVCLRITDDGSGFHPDATTAGFGLSGMAERAELVGGHLDIRSAPGRGTTVEARVPVATPSSNPASRLPQLPITPLPYSSRLPSSRLPQLPIFSAPRLTPTPDYSRLKPGRDPYWPKDLRCNTGHKSCAHPTSALRHRSAAARPAARTGTRLSLRTHWIRVS